MNNSQETTNGGVRPGPEGSDAAPDRVVQARDNSVFHGDQRWLAGITRTGEKTGDRAFPTPLMQTREPMQPGLSVSEIIGLMFRHRWTILIIFVLVAIPLIAGIWTQVVPEYQAKAEVRVRPIMPFLVFRTEDSGTIPLYQSYVNTQVSIIGGPAVLQRVLDQQQVRQSGWYKNPPKSFKQRLAGNASAPMDRLKETLLARPRKDTEIIDVTFADRSANDAQVILNTVLDQYMQYLVYMSDATQDKLYNQLVEQYRSLETEILGREKVTAELRQQLGTATPEELVSGQRVRLDEAQAHLAEVQQSIKVLEWEIAQATPEDSNEALAARQLRYYQDEEWRRLDTNAKSLRHTIETSTLQDKHPDAIKARQDLVFAEDMVHQREAQLDEQWAEKLTSTTGLYAAAKGATDPGGPDDLTVLKYRLDRAKYEEQLFAAELKTQQAQFDDLFSRAQLLEKENLELLHKRELFDAVRQRRDQKNMERNVPASIEVLTRAAVPTEPYNDRRIPLTVMALIFALGLGGGGAYLSDRRSSAIYAPSDLPYLMQVPFLGYIPDASAARPARGPLKSQYGQAQLDRSVITESIRVVRTALLSRLDGPGGATILVTSAASGTGKSTFSLLLGKSLAQAGKSVLLIDADFQNKTLTEQFDELPAKPGLIQCLKGRAIPEKCVFRTPTPGLSVIGTGQRAVNDAMLEEIANGVLKKCIGQLRQQYNIILLDSPSVLSTADAAILSSQVDGTIMVERELVSHRADIVGALARLGAAGGRLLGTVFIGSASHEEYA